MCQKKEKTEHAQKHAYQVGLEINETFFICQIDKTHGK